jgi:hypothetical protein
MDNFREEILRRRNERRNKRSPNWLSLVFKLLLLIFVVVVIRFFGKPAEKKENYNQHYNIEQSKPENYSE